MHSLELGYPNHMESPALVEAAKKAIDDDGFFDLESPEIGRSILKIDEENFPFFTENGLRFYQEQVHSDKRISEILDWFFKGQRCILGHWLRYDAYPGHVVCFRRGGPKAGQNALLVHLWAKGSRAKYYGYSHHHELPTRPGERSLHEIPEFALASTGCRAVEKRFDSGGIVVLDARVGYEMKEGYPIVLEYGTEELVLGSELVKGWEKMKLPKRSELLKLIADMENPKVGFNFQFEGIDSL